MSKQGLVCVFSLYLVCVNNVHAQSYDVISKFLEQSFAYTIVMSDSDVFTVGFADFNPNSFFNTHYEEFGTDESVENRKKYAISTLPLSFRLNDEDEMNKSELLVRFSGLATEESLRWTNDQTVDDNVTQTVLDMFIAYRYEYALTDNWLIEPGIGSHLMYYKNTMTYNSAVGKAIQPLLDGILFNTSAWANIYEPHIKFSYQQEQQWGTWKLFSSSHYFYGNGWGDANDGDIGNPEGWYIANGATVTYDFSHVGNSEQSLYSTIRRVDVGGDAIANLDTRFYYEATLGWLMTPPFDISFVDNIGVGLSVNYGSAFKGGSLVFFFNQD